MPAEDKPRRTSTRRRGQQDPAAERGTQPGAAARPPDQVRRLNAAEIAAKREQLRRRFH